MARKFVPSEKEEDLRRVGPYQRLQCQTRAGRRPVKYSVFLMYSSLAGIIMLLFLGDAAEKFKQQSPTQEAQATVQSKVQHPSDTGEVIGEVLLQFDLPGGAPIQATVAVNSESWESLRVGDRVGITYVRKANGEVVVYSIKALSEQSAAPVTPAAEASPDSFDNLR